jgi:hypothetical protein
VNSDRSRQLYQRGRRAVPAGTHDDFERYLQISREALQQIAEETHA